MLLGVDVGGTFTDAVAIDGSEIYSAKSPTTPGAESEGVAAAIEAVLRAAGQRPSSVERFVHGMTVATNALLEERGAKTGLVTTAGFEDVLEVARQDRPSLYRLCRPKPTALVADGDRVGARERIGPAGVVTALAPAEAGRVAERVADLGLESVAICLLFSYLDPSHERLLAATLKERCPGLHVSVSSEILPRFREYERTSTTVVDAYLSPLLSTYLEQLAVEAAERSLPEPQIMRSSGGLAPWREAAGQGAWSVLSGPAGGAVGASLIARTSANGNAIGLDMGGTSCDVCVIEDGSVRLSESRTIKGRVIQLPMVDIHTVGAGGGSIAWIDDGNALRVGPRSAGADPGPACYGRGGTEPTVTDANLILGRLAAESNLADGVSLDLDAARKAVGRIANPLGLDPIAAAAGIVRLTNEEMLRALRLVTVERGVDPRAFALLPFGGAGPMHAAELAGELGIGRVLCPRAGGVLSAFGMLASPRRRDTARTVALGSAEVTTARIAAEVDALVDGIATGFEQGALTVFYELRYVGQSFELEVEGDRAPDPDDLRGAFAAEHERRYGFRDRDAEIELMTIRVALTETVPEPLPRAAATAVERSSRPVWFEGSWQETTVLRGEPPAGESAFGPVVWELPETTIVLPPNWSSKVDEFGTVIAERQE